MTRVLGESISMSHSLATDLEATVEPVLFSGERVYYNYTVRIPFSSRYPCVANSPWHRDLLVLFALTASGIVSPVACGRGRIWGVRRRIGRWHQSVEDRNECVLLRRVHSGDEIEGSHDISLWCGCRRWT
jgi:hypothetical protein